MTRNTKKLLLAASIAAGTIAGATTPAFASSLQNPTVGGNDYILYDANASSTYINPNATLDRILAGNSASPGGNIELFASSENVSTQNFLASNARTSISGTIAEKTLTLSSLNASDWFSTGSRIDTNYGANNFANRWFNDFLRAAGQGATIGTSVGQLAFNTFFQIGGFQRSSDPNIAYINTQGSDINIGLAGHFDLKAAYTRPGSGFQSFANLLPNGFQASEVVKANYNGQDSFLYSFFATRSGLTNSAGAGADGISHSGNYEVSLKNVLSSQTQRTASTPEPSIMLGLLACGGVLIAKRQPKKI
jgi:hypothetical protein